MLEAVEFAKWWEARQLEIWRATLLEGEKNRPMPAGWGSGFRRAAFEAWMARSQLTQSEKP